MDQRLEARCGDSIAEMKKLPSESINLIVTAPPYNLNKNYGNTNDNLEFKDYLKFSKNWLKEAARVLKKMELYMFSWESDTFHIFMKFWKKI